MLKSMNIVVCSVSMDVHSSLATLHMAKALAGKVYPFVGIHPWSALDSDPSQLEKVLESSAEVYGIGEIGLDRKYVKNEEEYKKQRSIFLKLLEISEKARMPVSVHSRGSQDEVIEYLSSFKLKSVLIHWFSGSQEQLKNAVDKGFYVSFGPSLIYSKKAKSLVTKAPVELLLTETDGPVSYGACFGGRMALPTFIPSVTFALANILKMSFDEVSVQILDNFNRYIKGCG